MKSMGKKGLPIMLVCFMNSNDIVVSEPRCRGGLSLKAFDFVATGEQPGKNHLDGNRATK